MVSIFFIQYINSYSVKLYFIQQFSHTSLVDGINFVDCIFPYQCGNFQMVVQWVEKVLLDVVYSYTIFYKIYSAIRNTFFYPQKNHSTETARIDDTPFDH
jgi:hypothetical protein